MPKKSVKTKSKAKSQGYVLRLSVFIFSAIVLAIMATVFFNLKSQEFCANSISCIEDLSGKREADNTGTYMGRTVTAPEAPRYALQETRAVLGESTNPTNKHLYVDLGNQRLYAFEGNNLIYNFPVSTGKWWPTPTGEYKIWIWLRYTRMSGGSMADGTYYNLPNVPYTMYFANANVPKWRGYGIHGAYWHNNFGQPMSHGCVNMREEDVAKIYEWTYQNESIPLTIYGVTPRIEG